MRLSRPAWLFAGWSYTAFVVGISLLPHPPDLAPAIPHLDKLEHLGAYALMSLWFSQGLGGAARWRMALACALLGGLLEILQGWGGVRQPEAADALANAAGAGLGGWLGGRWIFLRGLDKKEGAPKGPWF